MIIRLQALLVELNQHEPQEGILFYSIQFYHNYQKLPTLVPRQSYGVQVGTVSRSTGTERHTVGVLQRLIGTTNAKRFTSVCIQGSKQNKE